MESVYEPIRREDPDSCTGNRTTTDGFTARNAATSKRQSFFSTTIAPNQQERGNLAQEKPVIEELLINIKIENAALHEKLVSFEQQRQEKQARIDELHQQNQQVQANLEHYRAASLEQRLADQERYEQQQKQWEYTIQQLNQKLVKVQNEHSLLQQQNLQTNLENRNLKAQLNQFETQQGAITTQLSSALSELAQKSQSLQHWYDEFHMLQANYDEKSQSFIQLQTQYAILEKQFELLQSELNEVREKNRILANEKWELGQEKAQLLGQFKQLEATIL